MNTETILRILRQSGLNVFGTDGEYIYLEDPACILRGFETFLEYAWIIITAITGAFLFGWAIALIRGGGAKDYFTNIRNLIIMLGTISITGPIVSAIYGQDIFARGCRQVKVSVSEINEIISLRDSKFDPSAMADLTIEDTNVAIDTVSQSGADVTVDNTVVASRGGRAVSAMESGRDVIYVMPDNTRHRYTGGTRAWRNTNPGNIRYSDFSRRMGAIGTAGGFSVFPAEDVGMDAIAALLRSQSYNRLTIAGAISRYAPPFENDTAAYHRRIQQLTGLSINKRMSELSDAELLRVSSAIRTIEGWKPGQIIHMQ